MILEKIIEKSDNSQMEEWAKMLDRKSNIPMPLDGYIVDKQKLEELGDLAKPLTPAEVSDYLNVVGSLIWIVGVRFDVSFALMYLTWHSIQGTELSSSQDGIHNSRLPEQYQSTTIVSRWEEAD